MVLPLAGLLVLVLVPLLVVLLLATWIPVISPEPQAPVVVLGQKTMTTTVLAHNQLELQLVAAYL